MIIGRLWYRDDVRSRYLKMYFLLDLGTYMFCEIGGSREGKLSPTVDVPIAHVATCPNCPILQATQKNCDYCYSFHIKLEGLLSGLAQRASSRARHRGPPPWLGT